MTHSELSHVRDILAKIQDTRYNNSELKFTHFHASRSLKYVYFQSIPCLFLFCVLSPEPTLKNFLCDFIEPKTKFFELFRVFYDIHDLLRCCHSSLSRNLRRNQHWKSQTFVLKPKVSFRVRYFYLIWPYFYFNSLYIHCASVIFVLRRKKRWLWAM